MEGPSITIKIGSLADQEVDVLVNSTRSDLFLDGGGVSSALLKAAGASIQDECKRNKPPSLSAGDIVVTSGGNLKVKNIFHGFCANWNEGKGLEVLKKFVSSALKEADKRQYGNIAFPAVGTGNMKYPPDVVAREMIEEIKAFGATHQRTTLKDIRIVLFPDDRDTITAFQDYMKSLLPREEQSKFRELKKTEKVESVYYTVEKRELPPARKDGTVSTNERHTVTVSEDSFKDRKTLEEHLKSLVVSTSDANPQNRTQLRPETDVQHIVEQLPAGMKPSTFSTNEVHSQHSFTDEKAFEEYLKSILSSTSGSIPEIRTQHTSEKGNFHYALLKLDPTASDKPIDINALEGQAVTIASGSLPDEKSIGELWKSLLSTPSDTKRDLKTLQMASKAISLPSNWTTMQPGETCVLVPLNKGDPEYTEVAKKFTPGNIREIRRVQNPTMYQLYALRKQQMDEANPGMKNEKILYHGTAAASIDNINHSGFNRSYCGKNATAFGQGVYFAVNPRYSAQSTYSPPDYSGNRYIYQARVLVGRSTQGDSSMKEPPYLNGSSGRRYDSVTDGCNKMFVIFYDPQAYPEYLITFQ